jgi:DUF4097 and DUF4098 domain-containing protein YvlB
MPMRRMPAILVTLLAAGVVLAGCKSMGRFFERVEDKVVSTADAVWDFHRNDPPLEYAIAGPIAIDIESFNGNVIIRANEELARATVAVTRRSVHGYGRRDEAIAALDEIDVDVQIVPSSLGQQLQIRTSTTNVEPHFLRTDITIEAPVIDDLRVRTSNGHVTAIFVAGDIDIATNDGNVRLMTPRALRRPVTITNIAGNIDFRIRGESTGLLDCRSIRGRVRHHAMYGTMSIHTGTSFDTLLATLNGGENPVTLRTVDGDIRIAIVAEPTQVGSLWP